MASQGPAETPPTVERAAPVLATHYSKIVEVLSRQPIGIPVAEDPVLARMIEAFVCTSRGAGDSAILHPSKALLLAGHTLRRVLGASDLSDDLSTDDAGSCPKQERPGAQHAFGDGGESSNLNGSDFDPIHRSLSKRR